MGATRDTHHLYSVKPYKAERGIPALTAANLQTLS